MDAATCLLMEGGPTAVTVDAVVARSGVAKSTMYRHWATRDELVAAMFTHLVPSFEVPAEGLGFEDSLRALVGSMVQHMSGEQFRKTVPALLMLKTRHQEIAEVEEQLHAQQQAVFDDVFRRGEVEGRVPATVDRELLLTLLVGPLMMAMMFESVPLGDELVDRTVGQFLAGLAVASE